MALALGENRAVAPLVNMANAAMAPIEALCGAAVEVLHAADQPAGREVLQREQEVIVIGHEAVRVTAPPKLRTRLGEEGEEGLGLAGGLNAWGFAEGDPVNYSDPFGLCTIGKDCWKAFVGTPKQIWHDPGVQMGLLVGSMTFADEAGDPGGEAGPSALTAEIAAERALSEEAAAARVDTSFVVNSAGEAVAVPQGARGPLSTENGKGMQYVGGAGGHGMNSRVTGVRVMDPSGRQGRRVNYMNERGQTVDPRTARTISNADPRGHLPYTQP